ncbi:hypothetical protein HDU97_008194, partial [Phlyctochytrium planicorne]
APSVKLTLAPPQAIYPCSISRGDPYPPLSKDIKALTSFSETGVNISSTTETPKTAALAPLSPSTSVVSETKKVLKPMFIPTFRAFPCSIPAAIPEPPRPKEIPLTAAVQAISSAPAVKAIAKSSEALKPLCVPAFRAFPCSIPVASSEPTRDKPDVPTPSVSTELAISPTRIIKTEAKELKALFAPTFKAFPCTLAPASPSSPPRASLKPKVDTFNLQPNSTRQLGPTVAVTPSNWTPPPAITAGIAMKLSQDTLGSFTLTPPRHINAVFGRRRNTGTSRGGRRRFNISDYDI